MQEEVNANGKLPIGAPHYIMENQAEQKNSGSPQLVHCSSLHEAQSSAEGP